MQIQQVIQTVDDLTKDMLDIEEALGSVNDVTLVNKRASCNAKLDDTTSGKLSAHKH